MEETHIPTHIAVIPDGNRRWAKEHGLESHKGHQKAAEEILPALIDRSAQRGIKYFTFWVLSTENTKKRSAAELQSLYTLMRIFIRSKRGEYKKKNIRLKTIGNLNELPDDLRKGLVQTAKETENNTRITVIFAINYGGRDEMLRAIRQIMRDNIDPEKLDVATVNNYLDTRDIPQPDLIIRTGGEKRLSGFMLWQGEYAEYAFSDKYFPDFTADDIDMYINDFSHRHRRFGK